MTYFPKSNKKPPPGAIPPIAIERLLNDTKQLRTGLEEARNRFFIERNTHVEWSGLNRTPEAIVLIKIYSKHYLGDEYAAPDHDYAMKFPNGSDFLAHLEVSLGDSTRTYTMPRAGEGYSAATKPDPIQAALDNLDAISKSLEEDLATVKAGGWPTHLLNVDWDAVA